jgi:hypothetical protein
MAAAVESGCLSGKDLTILTPTLEELGLLEVQTVKEPWERAIKKAEDTRARNIARNVKSKKTKEALEGAADTAVQKAVEEVVRGIALRFVVDISGSMTESIPRAIEYLTKFVQAFPPEQLKIAVFNTHGREVKIEANKQGKITGAAVRQAFRGIHAGGGTNYATGVACLRAYPPAKDEDPVYIFVGDEEAGPFEAAFHGMDPKPLAFGLLRVAGGRWSTGHGTAVRDTARFMGIPCFMIDEATFEDPYAIPRTIRNLIAATPVGQAPVPRARPRRTLVDQILDTELLQKPAWA